MSYSQDFKKRVLLHIKKGSGKTEAAALFSVGRRLLEANPDMLQKELAAHLNVSVNAISRALMRMGMARKKRLCVISKASHMKTGGGIT